MKLIINVTKPHVNRFTQVCYIVDIINVVFKIKIDKFSRTDLHQFQIPPLLKQTWDPGDQMLGSEPTK